MDGQGPGPVFLHACWIVLQHASTNMDAEEIEWDIDEIMESPSFLLLSFFFFSILLSFLLVAKEEKSKEK